MSTCRRARRLGVWAKELVGGRADSIVKMPAESLGGTDRTSSCQADSYLEFMDAFRDTDASQSFGAYVSALAEVGPGPVLDLGVGRGELITLILDAGLDARGCEINDASQRALAQRGLSVDLADAAAYLRQHDDESVAGITAIQVVEHLEPTYLLDLLGLVGSKLRKGGLAVLETPNMLNWLAQQNFWLDVSHTRPYPPQALQFHLQNAGLSRFEFWYSSPQTHGASASFDVRRNYGDVAVLGWK